VLIDDVTESYGGGEGAFAPSSTGVVSRDGTITVDVMAKFEDGVLGIRIFELWKVPPLPQRFTGEVAPDGTVQFPRATIDPVTIELLPFFATHFVPPGRLAPGTHWSVVKTYDKSVVSTEYTVTAVGLTSITIHKLTTIKALGNETIDGTIAYDLSSSAPISGKLRVKRTDTFADGLTQETLDLTFDRQSDTASATPKNMVVEPTTLRGKTVRLEPLRIEHVGPLAHVGLDPSLWRWIPVQVATPDEMRTYVLTALDEQQRGVSVPFAIIDQVSGQVIGSTRYANIEPAHRRLEIGWTWLTPSFQRTAANTEAKLMLLTHAFETLGAQRVELKTDALNERSREAILRIGAVEEGTFRKHLIMSTGRARDTVYFSIIDSEWPAVKAKLQARLR
jgi:RimJ/RimL family protein N-acetyltransferase